MEASSSFGPGSRAASRTSLQSIELSPLLVGVGADSQYAGAAERPRVAIELDRPRHYLRSRSKRCFDLVSACLILAALAPLMLLVAALIRLTSKGPALFKQTRRGMGGQPFSIYKFRSMYVAEDGPVIVQATRGDPRITPVGRFIRRSSIDELPQLINVLQGHMSLIGPRPHAIAHDVYYGEIIPRYDERFATRPGLSGLAQVEGARGETAQHSDMQRRVDLDIKYIRTASLSMDVAIVARTAKEMMFSSTAY